MFLSFCLTLLLPHALGNGLTITGKYTFTANDHVDFAGNVFALFACDDTEGDSGKVHFSVWALARQGHHPNTNLQFVQAMGGTHFDGDLEGGEKVSGNLIILWTPETRKSPFEFWYIGGKKSNKFGFTMGGLANKAKLKKS